MTPRKLNMPIWWTTWSQVPGTPTSFSACSSCARMLLMRPAMPFSSSCRPRVNIELSLGKAPGPLSRMLLQR